MMTFGKDKLTSPMMMLLMACALMLVMAVMGTASAYAAIDESEPNDDFGSATAINMNEAVYGECDAEYPHEDYFVVDLPQSGSVKLTFANDAYSEYGRFYTYVYNKYYEWVANTDTVYCETTRPKSSDIKLAKGKNYFKVEAAGSIPDGQPYHFKLTYNIPGTTIAKMTPGVKAFNVKWAKKSGAYKYQLRYSAYKNMKSAKTVNVSKKVNSKTIKAKAGKKYFVQVRVAKSIGGKVYWSKWSAKKAVTTKVKAKKASK